MDRSFLSHAAVIAASRDFVCVRLLSYENKDEMAFLKTFGAGKSGEVENTVFCFLTPDGKKLLSRASRGPRGTAQQLSDTMNAIAKDFSVDKNKRLDLPVVANARLALNVAACDRQPLVVIQINDAGKRERLSAELAQLAWRPEFIGRFVFAVAEDRKELGFLSGAAPEAAVIIIEPDKYGMKGKTLASTVADASPTKLASTLKTALDRWQQPERNFWQHVKDGQKQSVFWETVTPVTDPMELRAREKGRKKSPQD
jgi:hypothetical protein